jgi:peptidoglycan/xylan/chitin deacetylase (PgdA/CDA1 family)
MIPILMYHQVAEIPREQDPLGLAMPPVQFEQQMRYLAQNGYRCLSLTQAVRHLQSGRRVPARSFVLTFDDGYQNVYSEALPILERFGFTTTIFLVAGRMGFPSNWWGQEGARSGLLLSWAEARDLGRRGYILGSHTLSHSWLSLLDDQSAFEEIQKSRVLLQDRLDMQVDFFSYPYSDSDARIEGLVESAGYTAACGGNSGPYSTFYLWRAPCLRDDTALSFALKASGWYHRQIALRESAPGRMLRHSVRMFRRRLGIRHPSRYPVLDSDLGGRSEKEP